MYILTREQLLLDLHRAYHDARRHKRKKPYQLRFERDADSNLEALCDELLERRYHPQPSTCFVINDPKKREVFAAQFRDRIVHHLYYNYVHEMLERTFILDSYSCIKGRGTHYGIRRLERHILRESQNYQERCYVMKMDIRGYFMHIDRRKLLEITLCQLRRMASHKVGKRGEGRWRDLVDMDFVEYLTEIIVLLNPVIDCRRRGTLLDWHGLPHGKSLFHSPEGCGLPIGNLTSQLFSNVYMNELDQYVKRELCCRHYGRYVDDFYVVSADKSWLVTLQEPIKAFLRERLGLEVNAGKTRIHDVRHGVDFLGAYLKSGRRYVSSVTLARMRPKAARLSAVSGPEKLRSTVNSYLGLLSHYSSWHIRREMFYGRRFVYRHGHFLRGMVKYVLHAHAGIQRPSPCLPACCCPAWTRSLA